MRRWRLEAALTLLAVGLFAAAALVAAAGAANDPFKAFGKPSGYYMRTVKGQKLVCEYWAYFSTNRLSVLVDRCVPVMVKRKKHGPAA